MRLNVREIFDRTAVGVGPRLPGMGTQSGVDARYPAHTPPHVLPAASMAPMMPPGAFVTPPPKRRHKLVGLTLALVSAVAIGVVAALIQNAL
ncbi:MAG: hypothetical protein MJE77_15645 [Proteobacteria bacterium]|nr:hypothetical protein [Pseudomonadota bacterium]